MLTKTQLRTAKTAELERLQSRIAAELDARRQQEAIQQQEATSLGKERLFYSGHRGTYQWEYVQCGNKDRCKKCKQDTKHGPYLYRYFYKDSKQKSEYIKLSDLPKHPDAPARPA